MAMDFRVPDKGHVWNGGMSRSTKARPAGGEMLKRCKFRYRGSMFLGDDASVPVGATIASR